jgi:hypothetical protein
MEPTDAPGDEMRRHVRNPVPPLDPSMVERMLDGAVQAEDVPVEYRDVLRMLAAAAAPAAGPPAAAEAAALAAFRSTRRPAHPPRRTSVLTKLLGAKALAALVLGTASVGTAAAAATGTLPDGAQAAAHRVVASVPDSDRSDAAEEARKSAAKSDGALPGALGLCRAYAAGAGKEKGARLDSTAFQQLAEEAGGAEGVEAYCTTVLAAERGSAPGSSSARAGADTTVLVGLCRSWLAADAKDRTDGLSKSVLDRLATAAAGADSIEAYCSELAGPAPADLQPGAPAKAPVSPGTDARVDHNSPSHPAPPTPRG